MWWPFRHGKRTHALWSNTCSAAGLRIQKLLPDQCRPTLQQLVTSGTAHICQPAVMQCTSCRSIMLYVQQDAGTLLQTSRHLHLCCKMHHATAVAFLAATAAAAINGHAAPHVQATRCSNIMHDTNTAALDPERGIAAVHCCTVAASGVPTANNEGRICCCCTQQP
jgi:hypothetical protein